MAAPAALQTALPGPFSHICDVILLMSNMRGAPRQVHFWQHSRSGLLHQNWCQALLRPGVRGMSCRRIKSQAFGAHVEHCSLAI